MTEPTAAPRPLGRLLKMKSVEEQTSLHRATIYRRIAEGTFPKPRKIGGNRVAWSERDIEMWKTIAFGCPL